MLALTGFHNWFKSSIHQWLQIVHERSCDRIRKAVETDKVTMRFLMSHDVLFKDDSQVSGIRCYFYFVLDVCECM